MNITQITPPTTQIITLEELKDEIGLTADDTTHDSRLNRLLISASEFVEKDTGLTIRPQTWRQDERCWRSTFFLAKNPVQSIVIKYHDVNGQEQTLASSEYALYNFPTPKVVITGEMPETDNRHFPISITLNCGYTEIPALVKSMALKRAMLDDEFRDGIHKPSTAYERAANLNRKRPVL